MSIHENIEAALSRSVCGGWDRAFLESILEQTAKGRTLSVKQKQALGKVLARNTAEAQLAHENWSKAYESEYKSHAQILATYHMRQPYYKPMATDILDGKVPERRKFLRMYENKYSKKVLLQATTPPKYAMGDYISARASFDPYKHVDFGNTEPSWVIQKDTVMSFKTRGGFIIEITKAIHSAAKGAKRYKILPIGATIPVIIEERHIKLNKKKR